MDSRLRAQDWRRLNECVLDLHEARDLADLPARILAGVRHLIPYDSASLQDDRGGIRQIPWLYVDQAWRPGEETGVRMMSVYDPPFHLMRDAFFAVSGELHPHTAFYRQTGDGSARRISEIVPMRRLRRTAFYHEISRRNRLRWQLTFYLPLCGANTLTVAACRQDFDFSERERDLLELLRPHVKSVWRRAMETERQRAELRALADCSPRDVSCDPEAAAAILKKRLGIAPRAADVLVWLSEGKTNAEIALILGLQRSTVKTYVEQLLARLNCETRTAAARSALEALRSLPIPLRHGQTRP